MPELAGATPSPHNHRFFASTRGRLVELLRRAGRTVEELSAALGLTDNAVRAHLTSLERDGLVRQTGMRRTGGIGKPAYTYGLTSEAEALFPKAYDELLRQLMTLLAERLPSDQLEALLRELARRLAGGHSSLGEPQERVQAATSYLCSLGGLAEWTATGEGYRIGGLSCPLAAIVPRNPNACHLAELILEEITGMATEEHCRQQPPRCEFLLTP
jgi:predicted ArsR family transcriptional regulator